MSWEQKIKDLELTPYARVKLVADGYNLTIEVTLHKRRLVMQWFVDGKWIGEYMDASSEIGAKFGHPQYYRPSSKDIEFAKLMHRINNLKTNSRTRFNAKTYKAEHTKVICYLPFHPSAASLIRTLKKNCKEIILVE